MKMYYLIEKKKGLLKSNMYNKCVPHRNIKFDKCAHEINTYIMVKSSYA